MNYNGRWQTKMNYKRGLVQELNYKGWTNKRTCKVAEAIDNDKKLFNEAISLINTFDRDDFRCLVFRVVFRDIKLDSVYIDPEENINWEEIAEHFKGKL